MGGRTARVWHGETVITEGDRRWKGRPPTGLALSSNFEIYNLKYAFKSHWLQSYMKSPSWCWHGTFVNWPALFEHAWKFSMLAARLGRYVIQFCLTDAFKDPCPFGSVHFGLIQFLLGPVRYIAEP